MTSEFQGHSVHDFIQDFDRLFLGISVKNCIPKTPTLEMDEELVNAIYFLYVSGSFCGFHLYDRLQ